VHYPRIRRQSFNRWLRSVSLCCIVKTGSLIGSKPLAHGRSVLRFTPHSYNWPKSGFSSLSRRLPPWGRIQGMICVNFIRVRGSIRALGLLLHSGSHILGCCIPPSLPWEGEEFFFYVSAFFWVFFRCRFTFFVLGAFVQCFFFCFVWCLIFFRRFSVLSICMSLSFALLLGGSLGDAGLPLNEGRIPPCQHTEGLICPLLHMLWMTGRRNYILKETFR